MAERLLMIEDDQSLAEMVAEYLGAANIEVLIQADGTTGLERLRQETFDAIVLDIMLPDMDGFEVCRRIRAESDIPILMLTARGDETDRIVGLELGATNIASPCSASAAWRSIAPPEPSASMARSASSPGISLICWSPWPRAPGVCFRVTT